ncbi:MAG: integrin alpha, partial [Planctomycetota bacterium]
MGTSCEAPGGGSASPRLTTPPLILLATWLLLSTSSQVSAQEILLSDHGLSAGEGLGADAERVFDRDGDGRDDLLAGAPLASPGGLSGAGALAVFSSATGARVATVPGTVAGGRFGQSVRQTGDLNGDGIPELLVGEPGS